jgi:hypothetical protein
MYCIGFGTIYVEFVLDKVALGQVFFEFFGFPLSFIFPPMQSLSGRHEEVKFLDPTGTLTPTPRLSSPYTVAYTDCATADHADK